MYNKKPGGLPGFYLIKNLQTQKQPAPWKGG